MKTVTEPLKLNVKRHLQSRSQIELCKGIQIKYNIQNPDFLNKDEIFDEYNLEHNEKFEIYPVKGDFKIKFVNKEYTPDVKSEI